MSIGDIISGGSALYSTFFGGKDRRREVRLGHQYDNEFSLEKEQILYDRARARGITPTQYYGAGGAGVAGGSLSGGAQVLGNAETQTDASRRQAVAMLGNAAAERENQKEIAQIQADAQTTAAGISAGATEGAAIISAEANERIADLVNDIAQQDIDLRTRELEEVMIERIARENYVAEAEVKKLLNEASFTPEFKEKITKMTMGVSNSVNLMLQSRFGIDISSREEMQKLTTQEMKNVLSVFMAADSNLYSEIAGLLAAASGKDDFNLDPIGHKSLGHSAQAGKRKVGPGNRFGK